MKGSASVTLGSIVASFILVQGGRTRVRITIVENSSIYQSRILRVAVVAEAVAGVVVVDHGVEMEVTEVQGGAE